MTMSTPSRFINHSLPVTVSRPFVAQGALDEGWAGTCRLGAIGLWVTGSPFVAWDVAVPFAFDRWLPDPSETFCFLFCLYFVSACSSFFLFWPVYAHFFHYFFLRMKNSNRQIRRFHAYVTNKCTPCKPTCCIPLHHFRKILVNCLRENLKTSVHMIVFLKHDQLIQTDC